MFEQLAGSVSLRASAAVAAAENVPATIADRRAGSIMPVVVLSGRTAGTMTVTVTGSFDGGLTYPATLYNSGALSTNGHVYCNISAPLPPNIRVVLTPAASWDGLASVVLRTAGIAS